jgi:hypothetical protein
MSRISLFCLTLIVAAGFASGCSWPITVDRIDSFYVAPVVGESLAGLRAVAVLTEADVPEVIDRWIRGDHYRITGTQRAVREALVMSLGAAFESLEFAANDPAGGYDVLLKPSVDLKKTGWWGNTWHIQMTLAAKDRDGNLITEVTALGKHGFFFLPNSGNAFRFALRRACQEAIAEVAVSLKSHFAIREVVFEIRR